MKGGETNREITRDSNIVRKREKERWTIRGDKNRLEFERMGDSDSLNRGRVGVVGVVVISRVDL